MGFKNFFKKNRPDDDPDPINDLSLKNMKKGYFVDYDLETWEVVSVNKYDWGSDDLTHEWQLQSHNDLIFLEREPDDEDSWSISRKLPINKLDAQAREAITQADEAPDSILHDGVVYYLDETGGALFYADQSQTGKEVFKWDYADDTGELFLTIEQWGPKAYELCVGKKVEEYQFSNILPNA